MNTNIIHLSKGEHAKCHAQWSLSFRPLVAYLKRRLKTEKTVKKEFYRFLLDKIEKEQGLAKNIDVAQLYKYQDTLELIFTILTPLMTNEEDLYWALSTPIPDQIFFSTDLLYDFIQKNEQDRQKVDPENLAAKERQQLKFIYNLILQRFYNYNVLSENEIIYTHHDKDNELRQYFRINVDTQFIDITYAKKELPTLNFELFGTGNHENELKTLAELLPLCDFRFDGFTVVSISDVTLQHSIEGIREALVNHSYQEEAHDHVIQALKTLAATPDIEFGLFPLITVNDKPVFDEQEKYKSLLISIMRNLSMDTKPLYDKLEEYKKDPKPIFFNTITDEHVHGMPFMDAVRKNGFSSFSLLPVFYNTQLVGLLEIYSKTKLVIDDHLLSRLYTTMPLLGQLFQYRIEEFNTKMDEVIKEKFTALQPSVQWKFNLQAWEFIRKNKGQQGPQDIGTVSFKNLYPLFGAVDIRNSTLERNQASKQDLSTQLNLLKETISQLGKMVKLELLDKLLFNCNSWIERMDSFVGATEEYSLNEFIEMEAHPMLRHLEKVEPKTQHTIHAYFKNINPHTGIAYQHRRTLEESMQLINATVSEYLENAQKKLQKTYPCYFAKFRTDGIEYDIYIGQEIAPDIPFNNLYLKNIRLWQLTTMVDIARLTNRLIDEIEKPLFTTQLIFIHSSPIDIGFRNDERRFDVEGAYNIRYEVIKKRIDKVMIKGKPERLTQPGKIAMVYYNAFEAQEYLEYIQYLQEQGLLLKDLEMLDLEELQDVNGLKALRISVNYLVDEK